MFDYIYYRLYKMYRDKEGDTTGFAAAIALSLIQFCIVFSIFIILNMIFLGVLSGWLNEIGRTKVTAGFISFGVILFLFNFFYYKKNRDKVIAKCENHPANKWFRPWMLYIFVLIILFVIPVLCWQVLKIIR